MSVAEKSLREKIQELRLKGNSDAVASLEGILSRHFN